MAAVATPAPKMAAAVTPASTMVPAVTPAPKMAVAVTPALKMAVVVTPAPKMAAALLLRSSSAGGAGVCCGERWQFLPGVISQGGSDKQGRQPAVAPHNGRGEAGWRSEGTGGGRRGRR
ncbi:hypothetical protein DPEC_G00152170 [Dallia pectoralis]|uniref:Uncharacterized protein n=1 Tax=Dallia pectoralis TaxID=75939 RepID=A0ACC2GK11_DALPE|nr:hypothetical protein DPEC_G00152170 [Dallia pectoralis]